MVKIFYSLWFWIYTALALLAGVVFFRNLHKALEERDWLFYGCYSFLYALTIFVVSRFCGARYSRAQSVAFRTFHLTVFSTVNLLLAVWILYASSVSFIWFPYSLVVWGICLWSSGSETQSVGSHRGYLRFMGAVILFLAPMITILYVLITGAEDAKLAEYQRVQESRKETVQLNARLINQSLEKLKNTPDGMTELRMESVYMLDEELLEEECSGERSPELSAMLMDVGENRELIESWFETEDLSPYSHAFLLFAISEYEQNWAESEGASRASLPQPLRLLQDQLNFALTGVAAENYFVLNLGDRHVALMQETIYLEIADIQNPYIKLTKEAPPQTGWREEITALEETVYLYHLPRESTIAPGLSHRFSLFCLGWLSILMLMVLLYSRHRDRIAREKLDVASTVAHEFRTPLTGMAVLIDNLLEDEERETKKVSSYLQRMKSSNQRLHQISEHFFIEGAIKQKNINLETVNWSGWLSEQWEEFIALHESDSISFCSEVSDSERTALVDNTLLAIALQNILRNAYHYTEKGSITIALAETSSQLGVEVKDTGAGMDKVTIKSVFNKYSRGETLLSRETEGLGLGLYLALEIAKLHDGEITIESVPSIGSTFTLWISK